MAIEGIQPSHIIHEPLYPPEETVELIFAYREGDKAALAELTFRFRGIMLALASSTALKTGYDYDKLCIVGDDVFLNVLEKYDLSMSGYPFTTYLYRAIKYGYDRELAKAKGVPQVRLKRAIHIRHKISNFRSENARRPSQEEIIDIIYQEYGTVVKVQKILETLAILGTRIETGLEDFRGEVNPTTATVENVTSSITNPETLAEKSESLDILFSTIRVLIAEVLEPYTQEHVSIESIIRDPVAMTAKNDPVKILTELQYFLIARAYDIEPIASEYASFTDLEIYEMLGITARMARNRMDQAHLAMYRFLTGSQIGIHPERVREALRFLAGHNISLEEVEEI